MDARQFSAIAVELVQDFGERLPAALVPEELRNFTPP